MALPAAELALEPVPGFRRRNGRPQLLHPGHRFAGTDPNASVSRNTVAIDGPIKPRSIRQPRSLAAASDTPTFVNKAAERVLNSDQNGLVQSGRREDVLREGEH